MIKVPTILLAAPLLLIGFHAWINFRQPEPYMDELFHVPQAQEYCNAFISKRLPLYDSSITTPPALYIPNAILASLTGNNAMCDTRWLRVTSGFMSLLSLALMVDILRIIVARRRGYDAHIDAECPSIDDEVLWLLAFIIWLHPVNIFYANLFYTDSTSLFWVLVFWRVGLRSNSVLSPPFGVLASLSRQTNMIWHAYLVFDNFLTPELLSSNLRLSSFTRKLIQDNSIHLLVGIGYCMFVVFNKGIVLGDKSHHQIAMHHSMFAYFAAFQGSTFALIQLSVAAETLNVVYMVFSSFKFSTLLLSVCFAMTGIVLATGDRVHPFVLADNRHFTFYIYRRWLLRSVWRRLSLVPMYAWCIANPFFEREAARNIQEPNKTRLNDERNNHWLQTADFVSDIALLLCAYITLVPAALLEPRYFVVGSTLFCLRRSARLGSSPNKTVLEVVSVAMIILNIAFVYVFTELPFPRSVDQHMPNDLSPGRFMF